jgi:hypothetical protein
MHPYTFVAQNGKKRIHESYLDDIEQKIDNFIEYNEDMSIPDELIKFYRIDSKFNCNAFLNNYLWAANPRSFNDPFDCPQQLWEINSFNKKNLLKIIEPKAHSLISDNQYDNLSLFQTMIIATLGIVCFHEYLESSQDILWGYYNNQQGFSVKYDTHQLMDLWKTPFKVEYLEASELCRFSLDDTNSSYDLFPRFLRWTTQKKKTWIVENEWRFVFSLKADKFRLDAPPSERMKKYPLTAIKEVSLGLKFFDINNSFQESINAMYFIADTLTHQAHNQILTFLSDHQEISVSHMFFKDDLKLHPRKCQIYKQKENRFLITYNE